MIAAARRGQSQRVWLAGQLAKLPWEHRQRFLCPPKQGKGSRDTRPEGSDHREGKRVPSTETREPPQASAQPRRWDTRTEAVAMEAASGCTASCTAGWLAVEYDGGWSTPTWVGPCPAHIRPAVCWCWQLKRNLSLTQYLLKRIACVYWDWLKLCNAAETTVLITWTISFRETSDPIIKHGGNSRGPTKRSALTLPPGGNLVIWGPDSALRVSSSALITYLSPLLPQVIKPLSLFCWKRLKVWKRKQQTRAQNQQPCPLLWSVLRIFRLDLSISEEEFWRNNK